VHYLHALLRKTEGELLKLETHNRTMNTTEYPPRHIPGFRPLVPGEQWHRTDFTPDMLENQDGKGPWRPLLLGEYEEQGDVLARSHKQCGMVIGQPADEEDFHRRTRRPLPPPPPTFEHDGKVWNSHVPGDPCPVFKSTSVEVLLFSIDASLSSHTRPAKNWDWSSVPFSKIIGYCIPGAEPVNDTAKLRERIAELEQKLSDELHHTVTLNGRITELEQQLATALTPRPIAEAGGVKEGFVRIFFSIAEQGIMGLSGAKWMFATHFIDIKLPSPDPRAEYERALAECGGDPVALYAKMKGGAA
jgi:hypothetical protein